jgi:hypothetical protein
VPKNNTTELFYEKIFQNPTKKTEGILWVDYQTHYLLFLTKFLSAALSLFAFQTEIRIVIDGSQTGKDHATLMLSLVCFGGSITLCWFTQKGAKGHYITRPPRSL